MTLSKYQVQLQSQTDEQQRFVTLSHVPCPDCYGDLNRRHDCATCDATGEVPATEASAKQRVEELELEYVRYSLDSDPYVTDEQREQLAGEEYFITPEGKARGPHRRLRAKLHMHEQAQPYKVVAVTKVSLSESHIDRLVKELAALQQDPIAWQALLKGMAENGEPLAAVTAFMYGLPVKTQYDGTAVVDYDTDTIKVALLTGHTPAQDTHDFFNDVSANQITGTGYTAGGVALASKTIVYDTASDQIRMDAADTTWTTSTLSATHAVVYKDTGTSTTSTLMGLIDFGATVTTTAGTFQITWDATGIVVIDVT